ncbi:MAG TPA: sugar ABC transporter permease [Bacilli bacterium]
MQTSLQIKTKPIKLLRWRKIPWTAVIFVMPSVAAFLLFKYYPFFQVFYMSLFDYKLVDGPGRFLGLDNYVLLLKSTTFWIAVYNTFAFFILTLVFVFWVPIVQALFLNEIHRWNRFYRFMFLVPTAVPTIAGIILMKWIYNPDYGLLNGLLSKVGLGPYGWLSDPHMVKYAIVVPGIFGGGLGLLLYYSALQGISKEIIEAAQVDGAGPWHRMRMILLPNLKFIIMIQFMLTLAITFLTFEHILVYTGGGPINSTRVIGLMVYETAFKEYRYGISGAISVIIFLIVGIITYFQLKLSKVS